MISKEISQISKDDIQSLIINAVQESKVIEYKSELDVTTGDKKKEFLADVSAFANASGGDLIFGIVEDKESGLPLEIRGIIIENTDEELRKLENIIRDGISPRIPSISLKCVDLNNDKKVLIIRIRKSWISPHRVILGGHDKFYSRNSKEKYPLDVGELKNIFLLSETNIEKIKRFREDRISHLYTNDTPVAYKSSPKIVLHVIPINAFNISTNYDLKQIIDLSKMVSPMYSSGGYNRINFDGFIKYDIYDKFSESYIQLYKNGILESVNSSMLDNKYIPSVLFEQEIINSLIDYLSYYKKLNTELPIILFLTLVNVKDFTMAVDPVKAFFKSNYPIDREVLITPEVLVNDFSEDPIKILKPSFDAIWNACGWRQSLNYGDDGNWNVK